MGLISALSVQTAEALAIAGAEDTDEELFGSHPLRSDGEREGYRKREAFRNSNNNKMTEIWVKAMTFSLAAL